MKKLTLITGVNGHVGRTLAKQRLENGDVVVGIDLGTQSDLKDVIYYQSDIGDSRSLISTCESISRLGPISNFIHCAALTGSSASDGWKGALSQQSLELWNRALNVNLTSAFLISRELFTGDGNFDRRIVFISSIYAGLAPDPHLYEAEALANPAAYGVSKAGLESLGRYLASDLAPHVKVNTVRLGGILRGQTQKFQDAYIRKTLLGRMAKEVDLIPIIDMLLDPKNSYITGATLHLDGGFSAI